MTDRSGLPGAQLVERGLRDLGEGRKTVEALLVRIAARRLRAAGLEIADLALEQAAELELYAMLGGDEDPYARYRALLRELDSFLDALDHRARREREKRGEPHAPR